MHKFVLPLISSLAIWSCTKTPRFKTGFALANKECNPVLAARMQEEAHFERFKENGWGKFISLVSEF